jgi:ABC-type transport system substrate-binding protein
MLLVSAPVAPKRSIRTGLRLVLRSGPLLLLLGASGPGCGAVATPEAGPRGREAEERAEAPALDTTAIVVAVRRLPATLDPLAELDPWGQRIVDDLVFEGLVRRATDAWPFVEPALAEECVLVPEAAPKHAWCHLRSDRVFHDGTPVTAADVVESLASWLDPRRDALRARHGLVDLKRVELGDGPPGDDARKDPAKWIHIEVERADPLLLERVAAMKVMPKGKRKGSGSAFGRAPIGTGPMMVASFGEDVLELVRAPGAARTAGSERLRFEIVTDGALAMVRMRRGDVHITAELPAAFVPDELAKPGMAARFDAWRLTPPRYDLLLYNMRRAPTATRALRDALDTALPRGAIAAVRDDVPAASARVPVDRTPPVEIDLAGLHDAKAAAKWGAHGLPEKASETADSEATTRAAAALDALGWKIERGVRRRKDTTMRIVLMWDGAGGNSGQAASAVRSTWQKLGVTTPQATASFAYLFGLMTRGEFDVALARLSIPSDADLHPYFHSKGKLNVPGVADAQLDEALERYRDARTRADRERALDDVAARLEAVRAVSVLYAPQQLMLTSVRIENLEFIDDLPRLDTLTLSSHHRWPPEP